MYSFQMVMAKMIPKSPSEEKKKLSNTQFLHFLSHRQAGAQQSFSNSQKCFVIIRTYGAEGLHKPSW